MCWRICRPVSFGRGTSGGSHVPGPPSYHCISLLSRAWGVLRKEKRGKKRDKEGAREQSREDAIKSLGHRWQCQASLWLIHHHSAQELFSSLCDCVRRAQCVVLFVNLLSINHTAARGNQWVPICSVLRYARINSTWVYARKAGDLNKQVLTVCILETEYRLALLITPKLLVISFRIKKKHWCEWDREPIFSKWPNPGFE